ncbi:MAG: hypothetical protein L3J82_07860, partial [Planctomycetes bacterium]|nr:hypothetical protein [Planctomycetota bacterium]
CARLVREFHLDAGWLLTGDSARRISSATASHDTLANDLLSSVQAINTTAHTALGALTGQHHETIARELADATRHYEKQCSQIGEHAKPIYKDLAVWLEKAVDRLDIDTADDLMRAADEVEGLCFDNGVSTRHLELKVRIAVLRGQYGKALEYQRRMFHMPVDKAELDSNEFCNTVTRLSITLDFAGEKARALRVAKVAMLLCEGNEAGLEHYPDLASNAGAKMVEEGELLSGLKLQQQWTGKIANEFRRDAALRKLAVSMLLVGALAPEGAFIWGKREHIKALDMLDISMLLCKPELLRMAIGYYKDPKTPKHKIYQHRQYIILYAEAVLAVLTGKKKLAIAKGFKAAECAPTDAKVIFDALLHRVKGNEENLLTGVKLAIETLGDKPTTTIPLIMAAIHHKNVLASGIEDPATEAFVEKYREYALFAF